MYEYVACVMDMAAGKKMGCTRTMPYTKCLIQ